MRWLFPFLVIGAGSAGLFAQEKFDDPFSDRFQKEQAAINAAPDTWEITCEVFSLPMKDAANLRRRYQDSEKIYAEVRKRVDGGTAILEEFGVLRTSHTGKAATNSIEEYLYPTEYDPAELPNYIGQGSPEHDTSGVSTPANPTSYEKQDLGFTMEVGFTAKESPETIKVDLEVNRVTLKSRDSWGKEKAEAQVPQFGVQQIKRAVLLKKEQNTLVGSISPPREDEVGERKTWLLFARGVPAASALEGLAKQNEAGGQVAGVGSAWEVTCEVVSMPQSLAVKFKRDGKSVGDMMALLDGKEAILEELLTTRAANGEVILLTEAIEMSYPTEFEPPEVPPHVNDLTGQPKIEEEIITPASPTSYVIKNVGCQLQLQLTQGEGGEIKWESTFEIVRYLGRVGWGQGASEAEMPRFTSQKLSSELKVPVGVPVILGTITPPNPLQPKEGEPRVWFVLMTALKAKD